jgi:transcriptional regulator with XRE-family HTH domain
VAVLDYDPGWTLGDGMHCGLRNAGISVGEMANYLEVNRNTVGGWLNDRHVPSSQTLRLWAMRTGVPYEWLCAIRDSNPEPADYVLRLVA